MMSATNAGVPVMYNTTEGSAVPLPQPQANQEIDKVRVVHAYWTRPGLTWIGAIILCLACIFPVWDAYRLMYDAAYVFFMSRFWPLCTVALCVGVVLWYMLAMMVFFRYAWEGFKTEQTVLLIAMVATTMLGLGLLMISVPLRREVADARNDLYMNCEFGSRTQRLYEYSTVLQGIRGRSYCMAQDSIVQCPGFQESQPYTGFLKNLETKYKCAGFCWKPEIQVLAAQAAAQIATPLVDALKNVSSAATPETFRRSPQSVAPATSQATQPEAGASRSLLTSIQEISHEIAQEGDNKAAVAPAVPLVTMDDDLDNPSGNAAQLSTALLSTDSVRSRRQAEARVGAHTIAKIMNASTTRTPGRIAVFPPTLFSKDNYVTSCDGVVARDLKFKALAVGYSYYLQGTILLFSTVVVGLLRVMMLCGGSKLLGYQWYSDGSRGESIPLVL